MGKVLKFTESGAEPSSHEEAEQFAGFRLDRRLNYSISDDGVEEDGVCTLRCSGCCCGCEMGGCGCGPAPGCRECGYTGRRRVYFSFPARTPDERKRDRRP